MKGDWVGGGKIQQASVACLLLFRISQAAAATKLAGYKISINEKGVTWLYISIYLENVD